MADESLTRWRMVLGQEADPDQQVKLETPETELDQLLNTLYGAEGSAGFGRSAVRIKKWLDGIRSHFPEEVVRMMQRDALERRGLREMLLQPELLEQLEPTISNVATLLPLQDLLPESSQAAIRMLVSRLVKEIEKKLKVPLSMAAQSIRHLPSRPVKPSAQWLDWKKTIQRNLKHYQPELNALIPEQWYGQKWNRRLPEIVILMDKSESMIESMVYAAVIGSVLANLKAVRTRLIYFDTEVMDLTDRYEDPVDLILNVPCGGGTDIHLAVQYASRNIHHVHECVVFLISDLFEGGNRLELIKLLQTLLDSGVRVYSLLCIGNQGKPEYDHQLANEFSVMGIPCFACPPDDFPELLAKAFLMGSEEFNFSSMHSRS